jgi:hypothetical protein
VNADPSSLSEIRDQKKPEPHQGCGSGFFWSLISDNAVGSDFKQPL